MAYREGDYYIQDERTGRKVLVSRTVREWTGARVRRDVAIDLRRHPQEFQRVVNEKIAAPDPRPRTEDIFTGSLQASVTLATLPGRLVLPVNSFEGFNVGDEIGVMLANHDRWLTTIATLIPNLPYETLLGEYGFSEDPGSDGILFSVIVLSAPLPWNVEADALVFNYTSGGTSDLAA